MCRLALMSFVVAAAAASIASAGAVTIPPPRDNTLFQDAEGDTSNGAGPAVFAGNNGQNLTRRGLVAGCFRGLPRSYGDAMLATHYPSSRRRKACMSPTVFRDGAYRFFFFSREESRPHVHVSHPSGEAKFWIDPGIELAVNYGLTAQRLARALRLIEEHEDEIRAAWRRHFPS